jgi:hypothetical protein
MGLLDQIDSVQSMHAMLDRAYTRRRLQPSLKCIVVLTQISPEYLESVDEPRLKHYSFEVKKLDDGLYRVVATKTHADEETRGMMLIVSRPGYWVVLTREMKNVTEGLIESFLRSLYPAVIRVYLNSLQLSELLSRAKKAYRGEVDLTFVAYTSENRGRVEKIARRGEKLELARLGIRRLDRVEFSVRNADGYTAVRGVLTTRGLARLISGSFSDFYENVMLGMVAIVQNWDSTYLQVKRDFAKDATKFKECVIDYSYPLTAKDVESLKEKILATYPSVISHSGNPYFVAQISDPTNRASFELTLYGGTLTIIPVVNKSEKPTTPLWGLIECVHEAIGEGKITVH